MNEKKGMESVRLGYPVVSPTGRFAHGLFGLD